MHDTARNFVRLAQIELAYAELELMHFGPYLPELRRALDHMASAKRYLRQLTDGSDWADATNAPMDGADSGASGSEL
jgi:hypothetical protein